jgi:hypothetical protein
MSGFLSALGSALYERVFKAYKTTLLAMALTAADVLVTQLDLAAIPQWAHAVVGVVAAVLALYRGKQAAPQLVP